VSELNNPSQQRTLPIVITGHWESFVKIVNWYASHRNGRRVGAKSFGDGIQDICKDTESNLGPVTGF